MKRNLFIALILIMVLSTPIYAKDKQMNETFQFRGLKWGCSMSDIIRSETTVDMTDDDYIVGANYYVLTHTSVGGFDAEAGFFLNGKSLKFEMGVYSLTESHIDNDEYISDYDSLVGKYTQKYGKPLSSGETWKKGSSFKDREALKSVALATGEVSFFANWKADDGSKINITMSGKDYSVSTVIEYLSPDYVKPAEDDTSADDGI